MDKMKMETVDMTKKNIDIIEKFFPNCITEKEESSRGGYSKAVNFKLLKQMLSSDVIDGDEAYEFTWVGKKASIVEAHKPIKKTLRPCKEESVNWDKTENLYIEGDNLEVLKLLQKAYWGKVKMIYIDPPYNTGSDFIYNDDFKMSREEYADETGELDEDGNRMFKNTNSNGRFHSDWCSMIYPRLLLARNLLSDDGVIFISIDDNEQYNLRKICNEVFGEDNFVVTIHCQLSTTQGMKVKAAKEGNIVKNAEYIIAYTKNNKKNIAKTPLYDLRDKYDEHYTLYLKKDGTIGQLKDLYDYSHPRDCQNSKPMSLSEAYKKSAEFAEIVRSHLAEIVRSDKAVGLPNSNDLCYGKWKEIKYNDKNYIFTLDSKNNLKQLLRLQDSWGKTDGFYAEEGLRKIRGDWWAGFYVDMGNVSKEGDIQFKNGKKPVRLIKQLTKMISSKHDDIILDFFSGSATTAHAVMQLNAEDGGKRKFIMVQLPEPCDEKSEAFKAGYKNICEIGKERIRRAGKKIKAENKAAENLDIGFRVLKAADSNMNDVYYSPAEYSQDLLLALEDNIKADRSDLDLLFGCLLDWGLPLSLPYSSEQIENCTVHDYNDGDLIACFNKNIPDSVIKAIARKKPQRAVFRDSSFADSPAKINVGEIFKLLSPDTRVKVI